MELPISATGNILWYFWFMVHLVLSREIYLSDILSLLSKFRTDIDLHFGIKLVKLRALDEFQSVVFKSEIPRKPVGING